MRHSCIFVCESIMIYISYNNPTFKTKVINYLGSNDIFLKATPTKQKKKENDLDFKGGKQCCGYVIS